MGNVNSSNQTKYMFFHIENCVYAIEAFKTFGICEITSPISMPGAMPHIVGVLNLDNSIWPVIDLKIWLNNKKTTRNKSGMFLAVAIDNGEHSFLALIDDIIGLDDICDDMIEPIDKPNKAGCVKAFIKTGNVLAGLLSLDGLFDI